MSKETPVKVIFRKFKDGDIIALFPALAGSNNPITCASYMHIGQHGEAVAGTLGTPATPEEYADLLAELGRVGYKNLRIVKKCTRADYVERLRQVTR